MGPGLVVIITVGILLVVFIIIGYIIGIYNALIRLKNDIDKSWSNIDVMLKQRSDELPKLIATVKGYMKHEKALLENIVKARTSFLKATTMEEKARSDNDISGALKTLFAVAENYPSLKANENFIQLQGRISGLENEIADRREFYNDSVNNFNIRIESIPDTFIASMMKLVKREMFKVAEKDREDVKVEI